jgi:sulfur-carrier protein
MPPGAITVLLFGRLKDVAGWRERLFNPRPATLAALKALVVEGDPDLAAALEAPGVQAAVNRALVRGDCALAAGAEVAFMPAMSGG